MRYLVLIVIVGAISAVLYFANIDTPSKPAIQPPEAKDVDWRPEPMVAAPAPRELSVDQRQRQENEWKRFRSAMPYLIQTLAASAPYEDGTRTLLLSEPPPHVTLDRMRTLSPLLATAEVCRHTIGHDGWVKDIVFNVPRTNEREFNELVKIVSAYAFHSDYGSYYLPLPLDEALLSVKYPLDVRVGIAELRAWLKSGSFTGSDGRQVRLSDLEKTSGDVLTEHERGLVVWAIPSNGDIGARRAHIRRFALDSDLIVGALKLSSGTVLVCGRERVVPISIMPPLRAETVCLLASAAKNTDELAQSYERNAPLAGRLSSGWDWAPAYLSDELIDTEFGSVLDIADQLLKSWTEHGEVRYQNFPYPDPTRFPFDDALFRVLQASSSLLFNWNTTGAGLVTGAGGMQIYALNRTGSLPVIYRPDEDSSGAAPPATATVKRAEDDGYDFFATRNEPILARVVQYTALYQIFRKFDLSCAAQSAVPRKEAAHVVYRHLRAALTALRAASDETLASVARRAVTDGLNLRQREEWGGEAVLFFKLEMDLGTMGMVDSFRKVRDEFTQYEDKWKHDSTDIVVRLVAASPAGRKRITVPASMSDAEMKHIGRLANVLESHSHSINAWADIPLAQKEFSAAMGDGGSGWIHTQTVVVSCNVGESLGGIGGHNLASKVTDFRASRSVSRGTVTKAADGAIEYHPDDLGRLPDLVRLAATERSNPKLVDLLNSRLSSTVARPTEARRLALALGERPETSGVRGFNPNEHVPPAGGGGQAPPPREPPPPGTPPPDKPPGPPFDNRPGNKAVPTSPEAAGWTALVPEGLFIERRQGKTYIHRLTGDGKTVAETWNSSDAVYAVVAELKAGGRDLDSMPIRLSFGEGFSAHEATNFVETLRIQSERFVTARRVLMFKPLSRAAIERLATRVTSAAPKAFTIAMTGRGVRITGDITLTDANAHSFSLGLAIELFEPSSSATSQRVNAIVGARAEAVSRKQAVRPADLGCDIYSDLLNELSPGRRGMGTISIDDIGDIQILLNTDPHFHEGSSHEPWTDEVRDSGMLASAKS